VPQPQVPQPGVSQPQVPQPGVPQPGVSQQVSPRQVPPELLVLLAPPEPVASPPEPEVPQVPEQAALPAGESPPSRPRTNQGRASQARSARRLPVSTPLPAWKVAVSPEVRFPFAVRSATRRGPPLSRAPAAKNLTRDC
jgi:hypothetical protein